MNLNSVGQATIKAVESTVPVLVLSQQSLLPHGSLPLQIHSGSPAALQQLLDCQSEKILVIHQNQLPIESKKANTALGCLAELRFHELARPNHQLAMLKGLTRAKFQLDQFTSGSLLQAQIESVADCYALKPVVSHAVLRSQLLKRLFEHRPELAIQEMVSLLECELAFGPLVDYSAMTLGLNVLEQIEILNTLQVDIRCQRLLDLTAPNAVRRSRLPKFGLN